ncbi:MAG TPA: hypothetical protein DCS66_03315 [Flavobacteriaceae bacterium]|nr:hypothetical protein [Flavobacteriaceae bacterium]HAT63618.1 hypothetical protein [Flavobacteriaceae bacterium]|tara:strand:+ start:1046 stop:1708 length:663 start_codon:yes stop_codon:yes gene_type:complete
MSEIVKENLIEFVGNLTVFLSLFLPILYLRGFTKFSKAFKYFTAYLVLIGLVQLGSKLHKVFYEGEETIFFFFYFILFQFLSLSLFYKGLLKKKFITGVTIIAILLFAIQYILDPILYFRYNTLAAVFSHIILVFYSILYLYHSLSNKKTEFVLINSAILIYLLSSSLIFASGNLIYNLNIPISVSDTLVNINRFLYLGFQIIIIIEWWKNYSFFKSSIE